MVKHSEPVYSNMWSFPRALGSVLGLMSVVGVFAALISWAGRYPDGSWQQIAICFSPIGVGVVAATALFGGFGLGERRIFPPPAASPTPPGTRWNVPPLEQIFYGIHEEGSEAAVYDPPRDAPCPFCGKPIIPTDVRTHSMAWSGQTYARRSYFYRTHRTCAEKDPTHTAMDGFILDMIARNGD